MEVTGTSYDLQGLDQFTEYSVWLTAVNGNGRGDATPEVTARTFSDVPSKEPQNVTVEAASSEVSSKKFPLQTHHLGFDFKYLWKHQQCFVFVYGKIIFILLKGKRYIGF